MIGDYNLENIFSPLLLQGNSLLGLGQVGRGEERGIIPKEIPSNLVKSV